MPRRPRIELDRVPLHIVQRGHLRYIELNPVRAALVDDPPTSFALFGKHACTDHATR